MSVFLYCLSGILVGRNPFFRTQDKSWIPEQVREDKVDSLSGMLVGRNPFFRTQDKSWIPERVRDDHTGAEMMLRL